MEKNEGGREKDAEYIERDGGGGGGGVMESKHKREKEQTGNNITNI